MENGKMVPRVVGEYMKIKKWDINMQASGSKIENQGLDANKLLNGFIKAII